MLRTTPCNKTLTKQGKNYKTSTIYTSKNSNNEKRDRPSTAPACVATLRTRPGKSCEEILRNAGERQRRQRRGTREFVEIGACARDRVTVRAEHVLRGGSPNPCKPLPRPGSLVWEKRRRGQIVSWTALGLPTPFHSVDDGCLFVGNSPSSLGTVQLVEAIRRRLDENDRPRRRFLPSFRFFGFTCMVKLYHLPVGTQVSLLECFFVFVFLFCFLIILLDCLLIFLV